MSFLKITKIAKLSRRPNLRLVPENGRACWEATEDAGLAKRGAAPKK